VYGVLIVDSVKNVTNKWKGSQVKKGTRVTIAGRSSKSTSKDIDSPYKLQMIGNKVLVEEEPIEATPDIKSGLTQDVVDAIASGKLILTDESRFALYKYPYKGTILSLGGRCKKGLKVGDRISFAQYGNHRFQFQGKQFLVMHEDDVHGTYRP